MTPRPRLKTAAALVLAVAGSALCAGPAAAEKLVYYQATFKGGLNHKRSGHDTSIRGIDWRRETALKANLTTVSSTLTFRPESGGVPGPAPMNTTSVSGTDVEDTITMTVDGAPQWTNCVNDGEGFASPGQISFRPYRGSDGTRLIEVSMRPFNTFQVHASCSGFSGAKGIFDFASAPPVDKFVVPASSLDQTDMISKTITGTAPCPVTANTEPTISCSSTWFGRLELNRIGELASLEPTKKPRAGSGGKAGKTRVGSVVGRVDKGLKKGSVTAACPSGCTGKISAYAVALAKKRAKGSVTAAAKRKPGAVLLGKGKLRSKGGIARGSVSFDKRDRKAIRKLGAIEYRLTVKPKGGKAQTRKVRVRV